MNTLIVLFFVFAVLPLALLVAMPGQRSFAILTAILTSLLGWLWLATLVKPQSGFGASLFNWLLIASSVAVFAGVVLKSALLSARRDTRPEARKTQD